MSKIRIINPDWRVDYTYLCNEDQLPVIQSLGFYEEIKEISEEEYDILKTQPRYKDYESFLESFSSFPFVHQKLKEMESNKLR